MPRMVLVSSDCRYWKLAYCCGRGVVWTRRDESSRVSTSHLSHASTIHPNRIALRAHRHTRIAIRIPYHS
jgi:hypothetical protein